MRAFDNFVAAASLLSNIAPSFALELGKNAPFDSAGF